MAYQPIKIYVGRTNVIAVKFDGDISGETMVSEIRKGRSINSELIATFVPSLQTDGTDGILLLTLDDSVTATIEHTSGWMDVKKILGGEPRNAFDGSIPVVFEGVVTA